MLAMMLNQTLTNKALQYNPTTRSYSATIGPYKTILQHALEYNSTTGPCITTYNKALQYNPTKGPYIQYNHTTGPYSAILQQGLTVQSYNRTLQYNPTTRPCSTILVRLLVGSLVG